MSTNMRRSFLIRNRFGFSIIEIIAALGIGSVLILFSGNLLINAKVQENRTSITSDVERTHLVNLQRSRNPRFLLEKNLVFNGSAASGTTKQELQACLTGKVPVAGCARFNQSEAQATVFSDENPSNFFRSTISTRRLCDARGCHRVQIEVRTGDINPNDKIDIFERHSVGFLPGYAFVDDSNLDIDCGTSVMTGFNYYSMLPQCGPLAGNYQCGGGDRLMNIGNGAIATDPALCFDMARWQCTNANQYGVNYTGILANQQFCQGPAAPIDSSCSPQWLPRIEDVCTGVAFTQNDGCGNSRGSTGTGDCAALRYPNTTNSGPYIPPTTLAPITTTTVAPVTTTTSGGICSGRVLFPYASTGSPNCTSMPLPDSCSAISCATDGAVLQRPYGGCANAACVCRCFMFTTTTTMATTTTAPTCVLVPRVGWCFSAGTKVSMANGSKKSIEDVQLGESVLIFDEVTGQKLSSKVTEVLHHEPREQLMYEFKFSDGSSFKVTGEHMLYTVNDGYVPASWINHDVQIGRSIQMLNEKRQEVTVRSITTHETFEPTYNIHVQGIEGRDHEIGRGHNYFANGILAHNMKWCCDAACQECLNSGGTSMMCGGYSMPPGRYPGTGVKCRPSDIGTEVRENICNEGTDTYQACQYMNGDATCP